MIWEYVLNDLMEPLSFIPQGILISLAVVWAGMLFQKSAAGRKRNPGKANGERGQGKRGKGRGYFWTKIFCMVLYSYVVFQISFWSREPGTRNAVNLELFGTWGPGSQARAYVIENVIMFIPFGILAPGLCPALKKGAWCAAAGFFCSLVIETAQRITERGYFQLDDIVMNTLGTFLGWLCWEVFKRLASDGMSCVY